jgi:hypothetical protein
MTRIRRRRITKHDQSQKHEMMKTRKEAKIISDCLRQYETIQMDGIGRDYLVGKSRGSKEGPMGSRWYELPVPGKKKTCKGQDKKSRQHNDNLDK